MNNTRQAYIAREPGSPGAVAYINAATAHTPAGMRIIEGWLALGRTVEKVTLDEALKALCRYGAEHRARELLSDVAGLIGLDGSDTPMMLRPQAD